MNREIEIRVFERTPAADPNDHPNERQVYKYTGTIDLDYDSVFDVFDEAKMAANEVLMREKNEEAATQLEGLYDDEDYASDQAKSRYYRKKYGDL